MSTLLLRLAGPLQSWGGASRFSRRETQAEPTKSAVLGLLAAASGLRRTDSLEDLLTLRFGVRTDQSGHVLRDFQTAQRWATGERMPLSTRFYLSDATFVAGVEGDPGLLQRLADVVAAPSFPLFLGRRSCPPSRPLMIAVVPGDVESALMAHQWEAPPWFRATQPREVRLRLLTDARPGEDVDAVQTARDVPLSFDSNRREYGWREVVRRPDVIIDNPAGLARAGLDFFGVVAGS